MTHLMILPKHLHACHCKRGSSNKVWAACLAVELNEQQTTPPPVDDNTEVVYLAVWGPYGGDLRVGGPKRLPMSAALREFTKKCREKDGEGYARVDFAPFLKAFGNPLGLALVAPEGVGEPGGDGSPAASDAGITVSPLQYVACNVRAVDEQRLQQLLADPAFGITEKVDGERCLVVFDGQILVAYNRKGRLMSAPPAGSLRLRQIGCPFVIDGERMTGDLAGTFVAFDLLEWGSEPYTTYPYSQRILTLIQAMQKAGLTREDVPTPTYLRACDNSTVSGLALLAPVTGADRAAQTLDEVQDASGEGVVIRLLAGDYDLSPLKYKFIDDIDAFVIDVNEGLSAGSLKLGLVRHTDGAVICVGNVRAGLNDPDVNTVRAKLAKGQRLVFRVTYRKKRTRGIQLVEPSTSMKEVRADMDPAECTTEQFGPEKADFIAEAVPVTGITL